jgi:dipeptidyl aminopeptidase/acylaminoacyl peptidase
MELRPVNPRDRKRATSVVALVVLVVASSVSQTIERQVVTLRDEPLPIQEALSAVSFNVFDAPSVSPDGEWVAYGLKDPRRQPNVDNLHHSFFSAQGVSIAVVASDIWISNTKTTISKNLTTGIGHNWGPAWSPDGKYLAFLSDRGGVAQLWLYDMQRSLLRIVSDLTIHTFLPSEVVCWTADSKRILTKVLPEGMKLADLEREITQPEDLTDHEEIFPGSTVTIYRSDESREGALLNRRSPEIQMNSLARAEHADLAVIDVGTGELTRVARGFNPVSFSFSPDGSRIEFMALKGVRGGDVSSMVFNLLVIEGNATPRVLASDLQSSNIPDPTANWSPDGNWLSYTVGKGMNGECYVVAAKGGLPRKAADNPHPDFDVFVLRAPLWDSRGQSLFLIASGALWKVSVADKTATLFAYMTDRHFVSVLSQGGRIWTPDAGRSMVVRTENDKTKQDGFCKIDLVTRSVESLQEEDKSYGPQEYRRPLISTDGQTVVYMAQDVAEAPELWVTDRRFNRPTRITNVSEELAHYKMGRDQLVEWRSSGGEKLQGALLLPSNYEKGRKYPLIVWIYGGSMESNYKNNYGLWPFGATDNMQLYATRGYAVLFPDCPIKTGTAMRDLADTILPGIKKVIDMGVADPVRIGVMGQSFGGYSTLCLIVQTKCFKAGVVRLGFGNLVGLYGVMGKDGTASSTGMLEGGQGAMGGTPWEKRARYLENSPVFYLDRVQTPLLIVHGSNDETVPSFLADEIFVDLRRLGKEVTYAKYEGESHYIASYANQVDYVSRTIAWFDSHLK